MKYIDDPRLLELRFNNGMMLLPFYHFRIMDFLNTPKRAVPSADIEGRNYIKKIKGLIRGLLHVSIKKRAIIGISNANLEHYFNGRWDNIIHGYYYKLFPEDFLLIETWDSQFKWKSFKSYDSFSTVIIYLVALSDFVAYILNRIRPIVSSDFDYMSSVYPFITRERQSFDSYFVKVFSYLFGLFIDFVKPRVILLVCGSYGGVSGVICKVARKKGVVVVDTQHGQVFQHKAYSASKIVRDSKEYMEYMPDYFYSFGDYWSKCVDWTYKKISVGNPYLNEYVNQFKNVIKEKDFLVISQPHAKDLQHKFVMSLATEFPTSQIVIRLHPSESMEIEKTVFKDKKNVEVVSSGQNLYYEMCSSEYVIGWCSTCLFELLAFGRQPIVVRDSISEDCFPEDVGYWINEPKEIREIDKQRETKVNVENLWHRDFADTVKSHLELIMPKT